MTEHILQAFCQKAAHLVWDATNGLCPVTVIAHYSEVKADGNAFATTLDLNNLVETVEALLVRLADGEQDEKDPEVWLPNTGELMVFASQVRDALPFSVSSAVVCGSGKNMAYASFTARPEMQRYLESVLLPQLKAQQVLAPQPEGSV